jgi:D-alanyl-D-alanine carboxypeptidase
VSVRQLLAHSSGILDFTDVPGWSDTATADDYIARALAAPLRFPPGTRMEYSNTNHALVQRIIETVSGERYSAVVKKLVLAPLGLDHTHFDCPASWNAELAQGYRLGRGDSITAVPPPARGHYPDAGAGLCASSRDVARFLSSILAGRVLGKRSVDDLHTVEGGTAAESGFGAGLSVARETTGEVWMHGGAWRGGNTEVAVWPRDSLVVVVLANLGGGEAQMLNRQVARSVLGLPRSAVVDMPLQPDVSGRYAGRYNTHNGSIIVSEKDGRVYALGERCYNQGGDIFVCDPDKSRTIQFVGDTTGIREAWLIFEGVRILRGVRARP